MRCVHHSLIVFCAEFCDKSHGLRGDVLERRRSPSATQVGLDCQVHLVEIDILVLLFWTAGIQQNDYTFTYMKLQTDKLSSSS